MITLSAKTKTALSRVDQKVQRINAARPLSQAQLASLKSDFVVRYAHNTTAIEGNTLTLRETQVVLENGITVKGKPLQDHLEVLNVRDALLDLDGMVSRRAAISESLVKKLHALIGAKVVPTPGQYRSDRVFITGSRHVPPNPLKLKTLMADWVLDVARAQKEMHPMVASAYAHGLLVTIHPFENGNGRTARLLTTLMLMQSGYPSALYGVTRRVEYLDATERANQGEMDDLVRITVEAVETVADRYLTLLS